METQQMLPQINGFRDFTAALQLCGMTPGSQNSEGVFTLCDLFGPNIHWHTEDPETDPWEWRMRVLGECQDIAYAKLFFKKSAYITRQWYPYFLAVRRGKKTVEEVFEKDEPALRIYSLIRENGTLPLHMLRLLGFFSKEEKSAFDRALTALQSRMFLTMCGGERKRSCTGEEFGWSSTVFCTTEEFFGAEAFQEAAALTVSNAYQAIEAHLLRLNPNADPKRMKKFIEG